MYQFFPEQAKKIFSSKGKDIIQEIGLDIVKGVVFDVLTGKNLRDSTELLTRKRIITLNAATLSTMIKGLTSDPNFIKKLPDEAYKKLTAGKLKKEERWLMQWSLGLTDKAFQNVLRDDTSSLKKYKDEYIKITEKAIKEFKKDYGEISGEVILNPNEKATLNWEFVTQLMSTIGSQTLAIRGSDKSTFGKIFEKLILGSLLSVLDFRMVNQNNITDTNNVFWLSSRAEKRESDATLLYKAGKGIRFDIGFIGRGNPEISLDKVSRFEREIELGRQKWYMGTIIIVDRIGAKSRIEDLAEKIEGHIVQMSGAYWPIQVAKILKDTYGYDNPILKVPAEKIEEYLKKKVESVEFGTLLNLPAFIEDSKTLRPKVKKIGKK